MTALYPLYHIVSDASRRALLAARGTGELPELPQGDVWARDWEPRREIERLMRQAPVGPEIRRAG